MEELLKGSLMEVLWPNIQDSKMQCLHRITNWVTDDSK